MNHNNSRQSGFAQILLIILVAALVVAVGYAAWQSQHSSTKTSSSAKATASPTQSPPYTSSPTSSASPVATAACTTSNLSASIAPGSGAAGTSYNWLVLTNTGARSCTESGYPGISLLNAAGTELGQPATRNAVYNVTTLIVKSGAAAYALLGFPDPGNFGTGTCSAAATNLRVYPPGQTKALLIGVNNAYCPGFSVSALTATKQ